jgi:uncharacterized protein
MKVVLDTGVLLQMASAGTRSPLFVLWESRRFDVYLSTEMVSELLDVLSRRKIQQFIRPASSRRFVDLLLNRAIFLQPALDFPRSRDPKDDKVVATAVAADADYLITLDKDLYDDADLVAALAERGIEVIRPAPFQTLYY